MICNNCESQLPEEVKFCPNCGAKIEVPEESRMKDRYSPIPATIPEMKKGLSFAILIPIVLVIIFAIIVIIFLLFRMVENSINNYTPTYYEEDVRTTTSIENSSENSSEDNSEDNSEKYSEDSNISSSTLNEKDGTVYYYGSTFFNTEGELFREKDIYVYDKSGDGSKYIYSLNSELYYIDANLEPRKITEDYDNFKISHSGEYVAYTIVKDVPVKDLYLYCLDSGVTTLIDSNVDTFVLSPNGETVIYKKNDTESYYSSGKLYIGGIHKENEVLIDSTCTPITVSDDGSMVCYIDANENVSVYKDNESHSLSSETFDYWFNNAVTEIIYSNNDSTYYFNINMDKPKKLFDSTLREINTLENKKFYKKMYPRYYCNCYILDKDTFIYSVLTATTNELWWLNSEADAVFIDTFDYSPYISEDGSSIVYVNDNSAWKTDLNEELESRIICDDVYRVIGSNDLSHIYIIDNSIVYYLKEDNELEIVFKGDDYTSLYKFAYNERMNKLFFINEGKLYSVGTSAESLEIVANKAHGVEEFGDSIIYTVEKFIFTEHYYITDKGATKLTRSLN